MIVTVDGHEAHASTGGVEFAGDDPVVLLIHGAGMDSTVWQLQTRYLAYRGFRAVAVDLPGHGRSDGRRPGFGRAEMADWVARFVDAAGLGSVHVVGHSMGTFIALELASRYADIVALDHVVRHGHRHARPPRTAGRRRQRSARRRGADGCLGARSNPPMSGSIRRPGCG